MNPQDYKMPDAYKGDTYISPEFRKLNEDGDDLTSGLLVIGYEYLIKEYKGSDDFENVGATANKTGEIFVATGTTPTVWTGSSIIVKVENISLVGATIISNIYNGNKIVKTFTTADDSMEIIDAVKGTFKIANFDVNIEGKRTYDIKVTLSNGVKSTYFKGQWNFKTTY